MVPTIDLNIIQKSKPLVVDKFRRLTFPAWFVKWLTRNTFPQHTILPFQESIAREKIENSADGEEDGTKEDQNKPDSDKLEEGCGMFP